MRRSRVKIRLKIFLFNIFPALCSHKLISVDQMVGSIKYSVLPSYYRLYYLSNVLHLGLSGCDQSVKLGSSFWLSDCVNGVRKLFVRCR